MLHTIMKAGMPVDEEFRLKKNRLEPEEGSNGKRISIVTGIHGDELEGQYVCLLVQKRIREHPEYLKGTVDIYPALNPFGIDSITRGIPAFDLDMNRVFPGSNDGDMNEYAASEIVRDLLGSDAVFDIHASNIFLTEVPQIRINKIHKEMLLPLGELSNMDFLWIHDNSTVLRSTLAFSLNDRHTPCLVVEMGVGMRITREYGVQLTNGIFRVMKELGIWTGPAEAVKKPRISEDPSDVIFLNAPCAGIFVKLVDHGTFVSCGDEIGQIIDPLRGTVKASIVSPSSGWLFTIREYPVVDQGSLMGRILKTGGQDDEA